MKIDILTLFPEMFSSLKTSILGRAEKNKILEINIVNIRDFSEDKHKKCDDYPFGGGAGMIIMAQPVFDAFKSVYKRGAKVFITSPKGPVFCQKTAQKLSKSKHLIFICGHYEGIDERVIKLCKAEEISIGNFILTGGEIACMAMCDAISRLVDGVISKESLNEETFTNDMLEYPQFTRPSEFMGEKVPEILLSGNHEEISKWRKSQSKIFIQKKDN